MPDPAAATGRPPSAPADRAAWVDGMRGLAILGVILVHVGLSVDGLPGVLVDLSSAGRFGVQLFFVASAFTLCLSWCATAGDPLRLRAFFVRRFFRIAPGYYLGIVGYGLLAVFLDRYGNGHALDAYVPANIAANALFVHGFHPAGNNSVVPGGWSIGAEFAFYAVFPLLAWAGERAGWRLIYGAGCLAGSVLISALWLAWRQWSRCEVSLDSFSYYSPFCQLPAFCSGILLFCLWRSPWKPSRACRLVATAVLLPAGILAAHAPSGLWLALTLLGLAFAGLGTLLADIPATRLDPLGRIGRLSYSMYLVHFVFAFQMTRLIDRRLPERLIAPSLRLLLLWCLVVALSILAARLSVLLVEDPGIALGKRLIRRWRAPGDPRAASSTAGATTPTAPGAS